jgi:hypothetical protein
MGGVIAKPSSVARSFVAGLCPFVTGAKNKNAMMIPKTGNGVFLTEVVLGW